MDLQKLYHQYKNVENITEEQFFNTYNALGDEFLNFVDEELKKKDTAQLTEGEPPSVGNGEPPASNQPLQPTNPPALSSELGGMAEPISMELPSAEMVYSGEENYNEPLVSNQQSLINQETNTTTTPSAINVEGMGVLPPLSVLRNEKIDVAKNTEVLDTIKTTYDQQTLTPRNKGTFAWEEDKSDIIKEADRITESQETTDKRTAEYLKENLPADYLAPFQELAPAGFNELYYSGDNPMKKDVSQVNEELSKLEKQGVLKIHRDKNKAPITDDKGGYGYTITDKKYYDETYLPYVAGLNLQAKNKWEEENGKRARENWAKMGKELPRTELQQEEDRILDKLGETILLDYDEHRKINSVDDLYAVYARKKTEIELKKNPKANYNTLYENYYELLSQKKAGQNDVEKGREILDLIDRQIGIEIENGIAKSMGYGARYDAETLKKLRTESHKEEREFLRKAQNDPTLLAMVGKYWREEGAIKIGSSDYNIRTYFGNSDNRNSFKNAVLSNQDKAQRLNREISRNRIQELKGDIRSDKYNRAESIAKLEEIDGLNKKITQYNTQSEAIKQKGKEWENSQTAWLKDEAFRAKTDAGYQNGELGASIIMLTSQGVGGATDAVKQSLAGLIHLANTPFQNATVADVASDIGSETKVFGLESKGIREEYSTYTLGDKTIEKRNGRYFEKDKNGKIKPITLNDADEENLKFVKSEKEFNLAGIGRQTTKTVTEMALTEFMGGAALKGLSSVGKTRYLKNAISVLGEESAMVKSLRSAINNPSNRGVIGWHIQTLNHNIEEGKAQGLSGRDLALYIFIQSSLTGVLSKINPDVKFFNYAKDFREKLAYNLLKGNRKEVMSLVKGIKENLIKTSVSTGKEIVGENVQELSELFTGKLVQQVSNIYADTKFDKVSIDEIVDTIIETSVSVGALQGVHRAINGRETELHQHEGVVYEISEMSRPQKVAMLAQLPTDGFFKELKTDWLTSNKAVDKLENEVRTAKKYIDQIPDKEIHSFDALAQSAVILQQIERKKNQLNTSADALKPMLEKDITDLETKLRETLEKDKQPNVNNQTPNAENPQQEPPKEELQPADNTPQPAIDDTPITDNNPQPDPIPEQQGTFQIEYGGNIYTDNGSKITDKNGEEVPDEVADTIRINGNVIQHGDGTRDGDKKDNKANTEQPQEVPQGNNEEKKEDNKSTKIEYKGKIYNVWDTHIENESGNLVPINKHNEILSNGKVVDEKSENNQPQVEQTQPTQKPIEQPETKDFKAEQKQTSPTNTEENIDENIDDEELEFDLNDSIFNNARTQGKDTSTNGATGFGSESLPNQEQGGQDNPQGIQPTPNAGTSEAETETLTPQIPNLTPQKIKQEEDNIRHDINQVYKDNSLYGAKVMLSNVNGKIQNGLDTPNMNAMKKELENFIANHQENKGQKTETKKTTSPSKNYDNRFNPNETIIDENGKPFVKNNKGSYVFGEIPQEIADEIKRQPAPIMLSEGDSKYGEKHIESRRGKEIRDFGYSSARDLVEDVAQNYNEIYKEDGGKLVLVKRNGKDKIAVVKLTPTNTEDAYSITTSAIVRPDYTNKKELLWKSEPTKEATTTSPNLHTTPQGSESNVSDADSSNSQYKDNENPISANDKGQITIRHNGKDYYRRNDGGYNTRNKNGELKKVSNKNTIAELDNLVKEGKERDKKAIENYNKIETTPSDAQVPTGKKLGNLLDWRDKFNALNGENGKVALLTQMTQNHTFSEQEYKDILDATDKLSDNHSDKWRIYDNIASKNNAPKEIKNRARKSEKEYWDRKESKKGSSHKNTTDQQGNPIDKKGNIITEKVKSVKDLTDEDLTNPSRSVELPKLPKNVDKAVGGKGKSVVIKKSVFDKNKNAHKFSPEQSREILTNALYNTDLVGQTQPNKKPKHWVAIQLADKNAITIIEVNHNKDNIEVVGWYTLDKRNLERIKRQATNEGGELLVLSTKDKVESLSTPNRDLSSADKGKKKSITNQTSDVERKPLSEIHTDEARFQGRKKLNETIVNNIAENFSDKDQDPIHIWTDPKDGKSYVLSGHHRYYGAKRAGKNDVKIIDRSADFTEAEAIKFAKEEANANRSMETPNESDSKRETEKIADWTGEVMDTHNRAKGNYLKADASMGNLFGDVDFQVVAERENDVNKAFNEALENVSDAMTLELGNPNAVLQSVGIPNKPIVLRGSKVLSKAKKHGYKPTDLRDLPNAIQNPIAIFKGSQGDTFAVLTELDINGNKVLVSLNINKEQETDVNFITSVYGKNSNSVVDWIKKGKLAYANKEKTLDYLRTAVPITTAKDKQEFNSIANVINNFENPNVVNDYSSYTDRELKDWERSISDEINRDIAGVRGFSERSKARLNHPLYSQYLEISEVLKERYQAEKERRERLNEEYERRKASYKPTKEPLKLSNYDGSREVYHGTKPSIANKIVKEGIKFGSELSDNDWRGGGYDVKDQQSFSTSLNPNISKYYSGEGNVGIVKIEISPDANIVVVENEMYAEDLQDYAKELEGVDAVLLKNSGEDEIVILNKSKAKIIEARTFKVRDNIVKFQRGERGKFRNITKKAFDNLVEKLQKSFSKAFKNGVNITTDWNDFLAKHKAYQEQKANDKVNEEFDRRLEEIEQGKLGKPLSLGMPNAILRGAGIENKEIFLHADKVVAKTNKHGYKPSDIKGLVNAMQNPIAVFKGSQEGSFAVLTEVEINGNKTLVSMSVGKNSYAEFNMVSSVYGKAKNKVIDWINKDKATYIGKEKALDYLWHSAPIAEPGKNQEPNSSTKIQKEIETARKKVENFENPAIESDVDYQISAYHGSPHSFDRFSTEHIGNGAGNQMFGWGLYFTDQKQIAEWYVEETSQKAQKEGGKGNLYSVTLHKGKNPDQYSFMEWYKPLDIMQRDAVQDIFDKIIKNEKDNNKKQELVRELENYDFDNKVGFDIYRDLTDYLGSNKDASLRLLEAGIDGVKYPTRGMNYNNGVNYVVFDENAVSVDEHIEYMKTSKGEVYGAKLPDGTIYINPETLNANTPIHEFGHLWAQLMPKRFAEGVKLLQNTKAGRELYNKLKKHPDYGKKSEDKIWEEALVSMLGDRGEELYHSSSTAKFVEWVKDFFKAMGEYLHKMSDGVIGKELTPQDRMQTFIKGAVADMMSGKAIMPETNVAQKEVPIYIKDMSNAEMKTMLENLGLVVSAKCP